MTETRLANNQLQPQAYSSQAETMSDSSRDLLTIVEFIRNRQEKKQQLTELKTLNKKNSLSKNEKNLKTNKENSEKSQPDQALDKLFILLGEQLKNGHTVYKLPKLLPHHEALFKHWQDQGWLTQLNVNQTTVNTPIVMQRLNQTETTLVDEGCIFWLQRQWQAEYQLAQKLLQLAQRPVANLASKLENSSLKNGSLRNATLEKSLINQAYPHNTTRGNAQQQQAIEKASQYAFSIITGGPGTGKTYTVAQLVSQLQAVHNIQREQDPNLPPLSIALTAPTGKAAQRMQESLNKSLNLNLTDNAPTIHQRTPEIENAKTLHRLLGIGQGGMPKYHANNPLPDDLIIVDEASMLGLELAGLLVNAIKPTARLILLGDANQLAAVDAGSVLADLCQVAALQPYRTHLQQSVRFDSQSLIGRFAEALQLPIETKTQCRNKLQQVHHLLSLQPRLESAATAHQLPFYPIYQDTPFDQVYYTLAQGYQDFFALMQSWYQTPVNINDPEHRKKLFTTFDQYRILAAGHQGKLGTEQVNKQLIKLYFLQTQLPRTSGFFYHGLPIMITRNDYGLGLFNGDIGICLAVKGELLVCFSDQIINTQRLSLENCEPAFAMTIHKSQGSEFNNVAICLDNQHARLLSQELIYTAVTRSRQSLSVISAPKLFDRAILQRGNRQTGLQLQFFNEQRCVK